MGSNSLIFFKIFYLIMLLVIFILPHYSLEGYSILENTTSELGAQSTPNAWIMNLIFVGLGLCSIWAGWVFLGRNWIIKLILLLFGTALIMTAIFHHAPIDKALPHSLREDQLHSLFANITGFSFSVFAFSLGWIAENRRHKIMAFIIVVLAPILSIMMFSEFTENWRGIWQRLIFILMFGWMIYAFSTYRIKT